MASDPRPWRRYLRFSSVGIELGLAVMVGLIGGDWLDKRFGTSPWLLLAGLIFGMVAGFRGILRSLKTMNAEMAADKSDPPSPAAGPPRSPDPKP